MQKKDQTPKSSGIISIPARDSIIKMRQAGKSIKAIAKELHISDKRISAFLRPIEERARNLAVNRKLFNSFTSYSIKQANKACRNFISEFHNGMMSQMADFLDGELSRKEAKKRVGAVLDSMLDAYIGAASAMVVSTIWLMPLKYKKLWLNMAEEDPTPSKDKKPKSKSK